MDFPIAEILANFAVAGIVFYFSNQNIQFLRQELERERREREQLQRQYMDDLRDWSGINPRFSTWNRGEGDTKRLPPLPEDEKKRYLASIQEDE